jgi:hypothetical protein
MNMAHIWNHYENDGITLWCSFFLEKLSLEVDHWSWLWNQKVHYYVLKRSPLEPIFSPLNLVHIFTPYFSKIHFNIILPSMPWVSQVVSSTYVFWSKLKPFFDSPMHASCPSLPILLDLITTSVLCMSHKSLWSWISIRY